MADTPGVNQVKLCGARDLQPSHVTCVHRGDDVCRFEGHWKE